MNEKQIQKALDGNVSIFLSCADAGKAIGQELD